MKKVEAIIRPEKLDDVHQALTSKGFKSMTIIDVQGRGRQKGVQLEWRVGKYNVEFLPKIKIEIICHEKDTDKIVTTIAEAARNGQVGDGKIFISDVSDVVRIRTGERGNNAI